MTRRPRIALPTPEEDAEITAAAQADPESPPWPDETIRAARRGRPPLPPGARKRQLTVMLDPEVIEALKADGPGWQTRLNALARRMLGLPVQKAKPRKGKSEAA